MTRETVLETGLGSERSRYLDAQYERTEEDAHTTRGGAGDCHDPSAENESVVLRVSSQFRIFAEMSASISPLLMLRRSVDSSVSFM